MGLNGQGNQRPVNKFLELEDHVDGLLPLHFMASNSGCKLSSLKVLLRAFPDGIKTTDRRGWLPLHWAAYNCCSEEVVDYLIEHFPQAAFCATIKGQLPFALTTHNHNFSVVMRIFDANPEGIHAIDNAGNNALHDAATFWNTEATQRLLSMAPELNGERNFRGQYPIHRVFALIYPHESAKIYRQLHTLQALVTADVLCASHIDKRGCTPLHLAIQFDSSYVVIEYLYHSYPSAALIVDKNNHTPLDYLKHLYSPSLGKDKDRDPGEWGDGGGGDNDTSISPNKSITAMGSALMAARKLSPTRSSSSPPSGAGAGGAGNQLSLYGGPYSTASQSNIGYPGESDEEDDEFGELGHDHASIASSAFDSKLTNKHIDKDTIPLNPLDEKTKLEKFVKVQTLLLHAHPSIARVGGTSSFSKFSVHQNVHK